MSGACEASCSALHPVPRAGSPAQRASKEQPRRQGTRNVGLLTKIFGNGEGGTEEATEHPAESPATRRDASADEAGTPRATRSRSGIRTAEEARRESRPTPPSRRPEHP